MASLSVDQVLDDYVLPLGTLPILAAMIWTFNQTVIIPVGARVKMDASAGTIELLEQYCQS